MAAAIGVVFAVWGGQDRDVGGILTVAVRLTKRTNATQRGVSKEWGIMPGWPTARLAGRAVLACNIPRLPLAYRLFRSAETSKGYTHAAQPPA